MLLRPFDRIGKAIQSEWRASDFRLADFAEIAHRNLKENPVTISYKKIIRWALTNDAVPEQDGASEFGQPPITVFHAPQFCIEILFWLEGTTCVHQHSFSGAFQVLSGSSIHSLYTFRKRKRVTSRLILGRLNLVKTEYLSAGDIRRIHAGDKFIHSLFHLDHPSVTLVIRTNHEPATGPQYEYHSPFFAVDAFELQSLFKRRWQLLDLLQQASQQRYRAQLRNLVSTPDLERTYFALQHGYLYLNDSQFDNLLQKARTTHASRLAPIIAVLEERHRRARLITLRSTIRNPEHRFFLASLLNLSTRRTIQHFIRKRFSGNPNRWILKWISELTAPLPDKNGENLLGIAWDEVADIMMRLMLECLPFASIVKHFQRMYSIPVLSRHKKQQLYLLYSSFRKSIFSPLFRK